MIKNMFKLAWRNARRHSGPSLIGIGGLAAGMACCLLIGLYIAEELSFDRFHKRKDRIFRLVSDLQPPGDAPVRRISSNGWPVGRFVAQEHPEVEELVYLRNQPNFPVKHEGRYHNQTLLWAGGGFFRIFSFPVIKGDPDTMLSAPHSLVLTQEMERKFFGEGDALGQTLNLGDTHTFMVTGVVDVPRNSHIRFDLLGSFSTLASAVIPDYARRSFESGWYNMNVYNYLLLRDGVPRQRLENGMAGLVERHLGDFHGYSTVLALEPLEDIYLRGERGNRLGPASEITYVVLLSVIAVFILIIAGINFVNLATARSTERAREVGLRKMVGSTRGALVRRFLLESILTSTAAMSAALLLARLLLPTFNGLVERSFTSPDLFRTPVLLSLLALALLVGIAAGAYPSFVLSSFRPIEVLKGRVTGGLRGGRLRKALVVVQFSASGLLIIGTLTVLHQLKWMLDRDPGFAGDQVLVMDAGGASADVRSRRFRTIKQELAAHPSVRSVSAAAALPGRSGWRGQWAYPEGRDQDDGLELEYLAVDHDFVRVMGLEVVAGRDLSEDYATDTQTGVLVNQAAVASIGWRDEQDAIGRRLSSPGSGKPEGVVVGVVRDYHNHGLREAIGPTMFAVNPGIYRYFAIRFGGKDHQALLSHTESVWDRFFRGYDFGYFFLDDDFDKQYRSEARLSRILGTFAALAVIIACLGLFGLATYTVERRVKEIGVRKVLGASSREIVWLLSREIAALILMASALALPAGFWLMSRWLKGYAFHAAISPVLFLITGTGMFLMAWLTVGWRAARAARSDPAKILRFE